MQQSQGSSKFIFGIQAFALAAVVAGFPLVAALSEIIDVSSTPMSIGMRAITALVCAMLLVISSPPEHRGQTWWWLFILSAGFWIFYLARMTNDTLLRSYSLFYEPSSYWLWAIGGSIVPLFGLARARYMAPDAAKYFRWCFFFVFSAAVLAVPNLSTAVETDYGGYDGGRAALVALNPISLGHLGVQLVLLSLWALFLRAGPRKFVSTAIFLFSVLLGIYLALAANSRGPLVSLVVVVLFAILASNLRSKYWLLALMLIGAAAFVPAVAVVDHVAGTQIYDRLVGQSQLDDVNTLSRIDLYTSAWLQFSKFPLAGYGLEDPVFGGYPHNLNLEAFMATGLFGGLLMLGLVVMLMVGAYRVLRAAPNFGWLSLLTLQQVIAMQFSGTISQATVLWGLLGALASVSSLVGDPRPQPANADRPRPGAPPPSRMAEPRSA